MNSLLMINRGLKIITGTKIKEKQDKQVRLYINVY